MKSEEKYKFKLLVEGNNDQHVVWALCESNGLDNNFDIIDCQSVENVFKQLNFRLQLSDNNSRIGIVVDADVNMNARWDKFIGVLRSTEKYDVDHFVLTENGLVAESKDDSYPKVGIWIMPNNNLNGMLEDFVATLAPPDDVLMAKADETLTSLEIEDIQKYKDVHRAKAKIHTFLAWQNEPGKPMGQAITAKILDANSGTANNFVSWLKKLFN
jgi:hypothetical protein